MRSLLSPTSSSPLCLLWNGNGGDTTKHAAGQRGVRRRREAESEKTFIPLNAQCPRRLREKLLQAYQR